MTSCSCYKGSQNGSLSPQEEPDGLFRILCNEGLVTQNVVSTALTTIACKVSAAFNSLSKSCRHIPQVLPRQLQRLRPMDKQPTKFYLHENTALNVGSQYQLEFSYLCFKKRHGYRSLNSLAAMLSQRFVTSSASPVLHVRCKYQVARPPARRVPAKVAFTNVIRTNHDTAAPTRQPARTSLTISSTRPSASP